MKQTPVVFFGLPVVVAVGGAALALSLRSLRSPCILCVMSTLSILCWLGVCENNKSNALDARFARVNFSKGRVMLDDAHFGAIVTVAPTFHENLHWSHTVTVIKIHDSVTGLNILTGTSLKNLMHVTESVIKNCISPTENISSVPFWPF